MSWHSLNNLELSAIRKIMLLEVTEAAELIGKVSTRTWQYWESGRSPVPADVEIKINAIFNQRNECLNVFTKELIAQDEMINIPFFRQFEDFEKVFTGANKIWWRVYQGVAAYLFTESNVELNDGAELIKTGYLYQYFAHNRPQDIESQRMENSVKDQGIEPIYVIENQKNSGP
jgi:hypothetical protein